MKKIIGIVIAFIIILIAGFNIAKITNDKGYEIEEVSNFSYFKLYKNEKYGVIDTSGNILVPAKYDSLEIPNPEKAVFIGYIKYSEQEYRTEVINDKNEQVFKNMFKVEPLIFKEAISDVPYEKSVLKYEENGKYGIMDFTGKIITEAIYEDIDSLLYKEGCLVVKQNAKYGVININGKKIIDIIYDSISADGYYEEETKNKKAGFIVAKKSQDGYKYGYINDNGKAILDLEYNEIERVVNIKDSNSVYLLAAKNGQVGLYKNNKQLIDHNYEIIEYDSLNDVFVAQKGDKQKRFTKTGEDVLEAEEVSYITTENDNYLITLNENYEYGIENKEGSTILPNEYLYIEYVYGAYFIITKDTEVSVYDASKKTEITTKYNVIQKIEGRKILQAIKNNNTELYNESIKKIVSMEDATIISQGDYIKIYSDTQRKYFDDNGKEVQNTEVYPNLELYAFDENGKWGFKDKNGNVKVEAIYDMVTEN